MTLTANLLTSVALPELPSRQSIVVLHRLPTRLRLGVPRGDNGNPSSSGSDTRLDLAQEMLGALKGVTQVKANPMLGTLVIEHDGAPKREATILTLLEHLFRPDTLPLSVPHLLSYFLDANDTLDDALFQASVGWVDLKTVLPLLLAGYGLRRLLLERPFEPPSGLSLLWWAYTALQTFAQQRQG